jgi:thiol-disulfide isomerase/thioredoxin
MTRSQGAGLAALVLVAGGILAFLGARERTEASSAVSAQAALPIPQALFSGAGLKVQISDKPVAVPAFDAMDLNGHPVSRADWPGKVVLINFWATWCGPCREEIPALIALQKQYAGRLIVLGLSVDDGSPDDVKKFVEKNHINYPVAIASEAAQMAFGGISSVPSTFVVNTEGLIVQRHRAELDPVRTEHEIRVLAKLPTEAQSEVVQDQGQILSENTPPVDDVPELKLSELTPAQREAAMRRLNSERCTCG